MRWALVLLFLAGCALTSKSKSVQVRYYTPVLAAPEAKSPPVAGPAPALGELRLRLGRVDSASYLRAKIAFRKTANEVGFYETRRWTEEPADYLRRALARGFFEEQGVSEVVSGIAPTLEIELSAFDEVQTVTPVARIELTWKLRRGRDVLAQKTLTVSRPIAAGGDDASGDGLAVAMGGALGEAVDSIIADVLAELSRAPEAPAP